MICGHAPCESTPRRYTSDRCHNALWIVRVGRDAHGVQECDGNTSETHVCRLAPIHRKDLSRLLGQHNNMVDICG